MADKSGLGVTPTPDYPQSIHLSNNSTNTNTNTKKKKRKDFSHLPPEERARREKQRQMQQEARKRREEELEETGTLSTRHPLNSERRRANRRKPGRVGMIAKRKKEERVNKRV